MVRELTRLELGNVQVGHGEEERARGEELDSHEPHVRRGECTEGLLPRELGVLLSGRAVGVKGSDQVFLLLIGEEPGSLGGAGKNEEREDTPHDCNKALAAKVSKEINKENPELATKAPLT